MKHIRNIAPVVGMLTFLWFITPVSAVVSDLVPPIEQPANQYEAGDLTIRTRTREYKAAELEAPYGGEQTFTPLQIDGTTCLPLETVQHLLGVSCTMDIPGNTVQLGKRADKIDMAPYEALAEEAARRFMESSNDTQAKWEAWRNEEYPNDRKDPAVFTKSRVDKLTYATVYREYIIFEYQCSLWTDKPENVNTPGSFVPTEDGWFHVGYPSGLICTMEEEPKLVGYYLMDSSPDWLPDEYYRWVDEVLTQGEASSACIGFWGDTTEDWMTVTNEELDVTLSVPAEWADIAVIDTTAAEGTNEAIVQGIPVTRLFEVREKLAYESRWENGFVWDITRWEAEAFDRVYGAYGLVHETTLGCDGNYVYTLSTPRDVQYDPEDPVSAAQYQKLEAESTAVLQKFCRNNNLQPWHPEKLTYGMGIRYGESSVRLYNAKAEEVHTYWYNGHLYVPIRAVSELLGLSVNWDGEGRVITIGRHFLYAADAPVYRENAEAFAEARMKAAEEELTSGSFLHPQPTEPLGDFTFTAYRLDLFQYLMRYHSPYGRFTLFRYDYGFLPDKPEEVCLVGGSRITGEGWYKETHSNDILVFDEAGAVIGSYWSDFSMHNPNRIYWDEFALWLEENTRYRLVPEVTPTENIPDIFPGDKIASSGIS